MTQAINMAQAQGIGTGIRTITFVGFGSEIVGMLIDMRWAFLLLVLLIVADFRFGLGESNKRHRDALERGDKTAADYYEWHTSRAVRRTCNKLADYVVLMLLSGAAGMALFEQVGVEHTWGSWIGAAIAFYCEVSSIFGHFFYLHGVTVRKRTLVGFIKALIVAFTRRKSEDMGEALEEAFSKTDGTDSVDKEKGTDNGTDNT